MRSFSLRQTVGPLGLLAFTELERTLSDLLGQSVDLVTKRSLKPRIRTRVAQEAEPLRPSSPDAAK